MRIPRSRGASSAHSGRGSRDRGVGVTWQGDREGRGSKWRSVVPSRSRRGGGGGRTMADITRRGGITRGKLAGGNPAFLRARIGKDAYGRGRGESWDKVGGGRNNYPVQIFVGAYGVSLSLSLSLSLPLLAPPVPPPFPPPLPHPPAQSRYSAPAARRPSRFQQTGLVKIYIRITWNNNPSNNYLRI